jgi:uncharacterized lipoprotein YmbA
MAPTAGRPEANLRRDRRSARARVALLLACAALAVGCGRFFAPRPDPSRFYVLTATDAVDVSRVRGSFGVGPISLPDYLKKSTIVTRTAPNEITPSGIDRWGEPLDRAVPRVLQENLRRLLGTDAVVVFPWYASAQPDLQVAIDLLRFEREEDGRVELVARWEIRPTATGKIVRSGETRTTRQPTGEGMSGSVAAQSQALGELSSDIANALRAIPLP